ncbi:MAG: hypothetical protein JKY37_21230 [Nannocystaceae bacterium]|nr:hypothetical protein [Nannocystaceae bacterium]
MSRTPCRPNAYRADQPLDTPRLGQKRGGLLALLRMAPVGSKVVRGLDRVVDDQNGTLEPGRGQMHVAFLLVFGALVVART